jgi:hypothetical protein
MENFNMQTYKRTIVLFLIFLLVYLAKNTLAYHLVGSDISYQCTSTPGVYKISLKIYRDCAGAQMCNGCNNNPGNVAGCTTANACCGFTNSVIGASPACLGTNFTTFVLTAVSVTSGYDIIQTCTSVRTICTNCNTRTAGTYSPGIEVYTFEGTANLNSLPASCCNVSVSFDACCRNLALNTISSNNYFTEAIINRCQTPCNSAPVFTNDAAALVCAGADFVYNLGAVDPDGDSLSYSFAESLVAQGAPVTYISPYSAGYPFPYFGAPNVNAAYPAGLRIDPFTGDIMFRPMGVFVGMLVVQVTQWRFVGGVWVNVGVIRRDVQFQTKLCTDNRTPRIKVYRDGVLQTSSGANQVVCAGTQICLDIVAEDVADRTVTPNILADTTDLKWNNPGLYSPVMSGATFLPNYIISQRRLQGPKADSFKFCWTPPVTAARSLPHSFTVTGRDRFCPLPAFSTRGINIKVVAVPIPGITVQDNKCGDRTFSFVLNNPLATTLDPTKSRWEIENFPSSGIPGSYKTVATGPFPTVYKQRFTQAGTYRYKLKLNSTQPFPNGCPSVDSGTIIVKEPLKVSVRDTFNCIGSSVRVKAIPTGGNRIANQANFQFFQGGINSQTVIQGNLDPNLGFLTNDSFATLIPSNIGNTTSYKVKVKDSDGCLDSNTFNVLTRALPIRELTPKIRLCVGDDTTLNVGTNGGIVVSKQYWYIAPNLTNAKDSQSSFVFTNIKTTDSSIYILKKIDIFGCTILDTTRLYVNEPVSFISSKDSVCQNEPLYPLRGKISTMYIDSFVWSDITTKSRILENDTLLLSTTIPGTTQYLLRGYQTYDGRTCYKDDTASLKINGLPVITTRPDAIPLCQDQGLYNLGTVQTSNPISSQTTQVWSYPPNPNAFSSPGLIRIDSLRYLPGTYIGNAFGNYAYLSVKANTTGCIRYDSVLIGIFPVAPISITGPPKFCDYDKAYSLYNLTRIINSSGNNETWTGRGVSYSSLTSRYSFTPFDTNNIVLDKNVRTGLTLATDSNILTYRFSRQFQSSVSVDFFPVRTLKIKMPSPTGGCSSSDTVLFRVTKSPKLRAGLLPTVCSKDDSVYLSLRALAGTNSTTAVNPQTSYWYFAAPNRNLRAIARGQVFMPFHSDIVVPNDGQNTYSLVYADTSTGCRAADTADIRIKGIPNVSIVTNPVSDSAVCLTQDKMFFTLNPLPDFLPPIDSISLTGAPGLVASIGNPLVYLDVKNNPLIQEQTYKLSYYYRTSEGCSNVATKDVRIQFPPEVSLSKNGSACEYAGSFTVDVLKSPSAKHAYGLLWSVLGGTGVIESQNNTQLVYTPSAAEKAAGKVNISIVTTNNGLCPVAGDTSVFTIYPKPTASFSGVDSGCVRPGQPLNINLVSGPNSVLDCRYIWEVDGKVEADSVNKTNFSKSLTVAKTYNMRLIVTNPLTGCSDSSISQTSTAWPTPVADFDPDKTTTTIAKPYFTFTNTTNPITGNTYDWDLGIDPQTGLPRRSTLVNPKEINFAADTARIPITLIAMSDKGCIDSITKFIRIEPDITVFIPNVFYPSTGGNSNTGAQTGPCMIGDIPCNRHFFVQANGFETIEIYVYNRWGKLVFQTNKITEGWDGNDQKSGGECQQDAYVYQIFATSYSGKKYQYAGSVTLLR